MDKNLEWIKSGKIGCTFATYFARYPETIGWRRVFNPSSLVIPEDVLILSLIFEGKNKDEVREWCLQNDFYEEKVRDDLFGLRYKTPDGVSWVQYFGPDSHVATRQTPIAEICFTVKRPALSYARVGWSGILHLAHASIEGISDYAADYFWSSSHRMTEKRLGHKPTTEEGAKTTFKRWIK